jgi:hypothetical protein
LFDTDATKRKDAQKTFCQHINNVIRASYGSDLSITHRCIEGDENKQLKIGIAGKLFRKKDLTHFRQARHKELYDKVRGGIMFCPDCNQTVSTIDIVNKALQRWKDCLIPGDRAQHNRQDTMIPFIYIKDLTDVCRFVRLLYVYHKYEIVDDVCITANNCNCQ